MQRGIQKQQKVLWRLLIVSTSIAGLAWLLWPKSSSALISASGGEGWNAQQTVGVRLGKGVVKKDTRVTFSKGEVHEKAPIDELLTQAGEPVSISPDQSIGSYKSQVLFKVPGSIATDVNCNDGNHHRKPSICNVGIAVYNTDLEAWIPIKTSIEKGNILVADAPHYSEYKLIEAKTAPTTVDVAGRKLTYMLDALSTPWEFGKETVKSYLHLLKESFTGEFDKNKLKPCSQSPAEDYVIDFRNQGPGGKINGCVIRQKGVTKVLVANGWAFPVILRADTDRGVSADRFNQHELNVAARNYELKIKGKLDGNSTIASGLDTAAFTVEDSSAPTSFTINTETSFYGAFADMGIAMFDLLTGKSKVKAVKTLGEELAISRDILNCAGLAHAARESIGANDGMTPQDAMAETFSKCGTLLTEKLTHAPEAVAFAFKDTKVLPEIKETLQQIAPYLTGTDNASAQLVVTRPSAALKGQWENTCAGLDSKIQFVDDGSDVWHDVQFGPDNSSVTYDTFFKQKTSQNRPVIQITKTNMPGLRPGDTLLIQFFSMQNDNVKAIELVGPRGNSWYFFRTTGMNYC